ncbi:NF038143 family protein [Desulfobulbus alkaliphilus]|uniref:NF038143 family protein n=1 Tax=Desulfobulbus alkaliphilus TaxID=869814 RepID=UPI0019631037|nr:NF038143 family protein [Desulfobulbus alkaliphilus]MBM9538069.1 NF038143 family protein [Desulfobulbus alkaliphilus]
MPDQPIPQAYQLLWDHENQFAYAVAKQVLQKPAISVWLIFIPILFLYYAHKIQQYKAGVHDFGKGLARSKILALDSALEEWQSGGRDEEYLQAFVSKDLENSPNIMRVRDKQIAEVELLKTHYAQLLRQQGTSVSTLIKKTYKTGARYRQFLEQIHAAENEVHDAVLRAYHPSEEAQQVTRKMQKIIHKLREEEVRTIFNS